MTRLTHQRKYKIEKANQRQVEGHQDTQTRLPDSWRWTTNGAYKCPTPFYMEDWTHRDMYHVKAFTVCVVPILYLFNFRLQMSVLKICDVLVQIRYGSVCGSGRPKRHKDPTDLDPQQFYVYGTSFFKDKHTDPEHCPVLHYFASRISTCITARIPNNERNVIDRNYHIRYHNWILNSEIRCSDWRIPHYFSGCYFPSLCNCVCKLSFP